MKRYLPDVNVWFALAVEEHQHHAAARRWWDDVTGTLGFLRLTQIGLLRLLTSPVPMGGKPLTNAQAWGVYDGFLSDERVHRFAETTQDDLFRRYSSVAHASPKIWADAYLLGYAAASDAVVVTFDQAFSSYSAPCRILR
jgi:toxin-antitoxin system PIN domain toxin